MTVLCMVNARLLYIYWRLGSPVVSHILESYVYIQLEGACRPYYSM